MALVKGTNSLATVAEADAYFADRLDAAAWTSASDTLKSQALVTATSMLNDMAWAGVAVSESQNLAFPRVGSYFDPLLGFAVALDGVTTPERIIKGVYELAYHLLNNDGVLDNTGGVESIEVGPIKLTNIKAPNAVPLVARRLISPLLLNGGSSLWWRAN
jgi:hypothetical protein